MQLRFAHVADFASVDASGKLTVVGIFDIVWDSAGARPIPFPPFYLVADLEASLAEGADQEIEVQLVDEDEQPIGSLMRGTMQLRAAGPGYPATGRFLVGFGPGAITVPELGDYRFRFRAGGRDIGAARISVLKPPSA